MSYNIMSSHMAITNPPSNLINIVALNFDFRVLLFYYLMISLKYTYVNLAISFCIGRGAGEVAWADNPRGEAPPRPYLLGAIVLMLTMASTSNSLRGKRSGTICAAPRSACADEDLPDVPANVLRWH